MTTEEIGGIAVEAHISKASIVVLWLSIPVFLLFVFCVAYLPGLISYAASAALKRTLMEALGVESLGFGDILAAVGNAIPHWLVVVFWVFMTPLIVAWFGWACVSTYFNTQYALSYTNQRIEATARKESLATPVSDLKNVFVGQSVIGKIFHYGNVTIQTQKGSITVKNITRPETVQNDLFALMRENEDSM